MLRVPLWIGWRYQGVLEELMSSDDNDCVSIAVGKKTVHGVVRRRNRCEKRARSLVRYVRMRAGDIIAFRRKLKKFDQFFSFASTRYVPKIK